MKYAIYILIFISQLAFSDEVLTWQACIQESEKNNPDVAAALEAVKSADAQYSAAYGGFLPQLEANAGYTKSNTAVTGIGTTSGTRDQYSYGLTATESVFSGFKDAGKVQKGKSIVDTATSSLQIARAKLNFDLKSAFASLLFAQEQTRLTEEIAARRRDNQRLVKLRYEGGRENKGSFLLSNAALAQADFEVQQAKRNVHVSQRQLARILGRKEQSELVVKGELKYTVPKDIRDFHPLAVATPDFKQAEAQLKSAEADTTIARSALFPEIDLNGSYSKQDTTFPPTTNHWSVGVSLAFPFFTGGSNIFGYQSAAAEETKAEFVRKSTNDQILLKLEQAYSGFLDAIGQSNVAKEFLIAADSRSKIARGKYRTGLMTFEDWDLIENDLINRQKAELSERRDSVLAEAAWEQAQGKGPTP